MAGGGGIVMAKRGIEGRQLRAALESSDQLQILLQESPLEALKHSRVGEAQHCCEGADPAEIPNSPSLPQTPLGLHLKDILSFLQGKRLVDTNTPPKENPRVPHVWA